MDVAIDELTRMWVKCTVYEAAQYPVCEPVVRKAKVTELTTAKLTGISTLFFAPQTKAPIDLKMVDRLGLYYAIKDKLVTVGGTKISNEVYEAKVAS